MVLMPPVGGFRVQAVIPLVNLVAGTTAGGIVLGGLIALAGVGLGRLEPARVGIIIGFSAAAAAATCWPRLSEWLPERSCQVGKETWERRGIEKAALRWGVRLGLGVCTFVVTPAFYGLIAVSLDQRGVMTPIVIWMTYGFVRGGTIAVMAVHRRRGLSALPIIVGSHRSLRPVLAAAVVVGAIFVAVR
jgi:hypothetical protein